MTYSRRDILERVRSGELTPEEAARLLDEPQAPNPARAPHAEPGPGRSSEAPRAEGRATMIRLVGAFRTARVTGDPTVQEVAVEGAHAIRREGEVLIISADDEDTPGFSFASHDRPRAVIGLGSRPGPISVRINPDLPLSAEIAAGTLKVRGVRAPISAEVSAGAVTLEEFSAPITVSVASGSVSATGRLDRGESSIRCEAGWVKVRLLEGSSVKVRARAGIGKISLGNDEKGSSFKVGQGSSDAVFGEGAGTLDIETSIGLIKVEGR